MYARLRCGGNLPLPRSGVDRPLRGNCHPLFCAPDNQVRCVFGSAPYQKQASTVRNSHSVLKKASWGTRRIFGSIRCKKQASTVRKRYSVPETAFSGTRRIFKGALNSLLWYATRFLRHSATKKGSSGTRRIFKGALNSLLLHRMHFRKRKNGILLHRRHLQRPAEQPTPQTVDSLLLHRTHLQRRAVPKAAPAHRTQLQCAKEPPLSLFAPAPYTISFVPLTRNLSPAAPSLAPSTALGTGNSPPLGGEQI